MENWGGDHFFCAAATFLLFWGELSGTWLMEGGRRVGYTVQVLVCRQRLGTWVEIPWSGRRKFSRDPVELARRRPGSQKTHHSLQTTLPTLPNSS